MSNKSNEIVLKLIVVGDSRVGKTSLIYSYMHNSFPEKTTPTIGLEHEDKTINLKGLIIKIQIWDTGPLEYNHFLFLSNDFLRNTDGIILVFDLANKKSFNDIKDLITQKKDILSDPRIKKIIVGNKSNIKDKVKVTINDIKCLLKPNKIKFREISAYDNENIQKVFNELINSIVGNKTNEELIAEYGNSKDNKDILNLAMSNIDMQENKKNCCCC